VMGAEPAEACPGDDRLSEAYGKFVRIELELDAHDVEVGGVHAWSALRPAVFQKVLLPLGQADLWQKPEGGVAVPRWKRLGNMVIRNPLLRRGSASYLVLKWQRRQRIGDIDDDAISHSLTGVLGPDVLEVFPRGLEYSPGQRALNLDGAELTARLLRRFERCELSASEEKRLAEIERRLHTELCVDLPLRTWFPNYAMTFRSRRKVMEWILRKWRIRHVFIVVAHGYPHFIDAAHRLGVPVTDLQHGHISWLHVAYDFPPGMRPHYCPDSVLLFSDYWAGAARYAPGTGLFTFGAPHIRAQLRESATPVRHSGDAQVLFISQQVINEALLDFAIAFARLPGAPKVLFRLHPADDIADNRRRVAESGLGDTQFELSYGGGGATTLNLQRCVQCQAGVYSTAVVEGVAAGAKSFIIPLPGWTYMKEMVDQGYVRVAATPEALLKFLEDDGKGARPSPDAGPIDRFFAPLRPQAVEEALRHGRRRH